ncbi:hypothetical protein J7I44_14065 [Frateuria sp. MAH-13]|uniref:Integrase n=1 Tax=Frateuria flava TaxID=2821489 RepID=A0ABS4DQW8_9GAMM|nr:hypothetical protein [Frateuria flava]MBP1475435.1 hypothetical protein [Frateuria flava]
MAAFIKLAREFSAFGGSSAWEADRWKNGRTVAVFATRTESLGTYQFTPMADPFRDFAKAYVKYNYSFRPVVSVAYWLQALRCLEAALLECCGRADILLLNGAVMDMAAMKCKEFFISEDVWHKTGLVLAKLFDFCRANRFVPSLPQWKSPFRKPTILTEDLGEVGAKHRESKLPTNSSMLAVADLFANASTIEEKYFSSIAILLMVAPSRVSEVLSLTTDCVQWETDAAGERQLYLRWHAAKGKGHTKKWVVPAMQDAVLEAVNRLLEIGKEARQAARFAFENPGVFMRHSGCLTPEGFGQDEALSPEQCCAAIGLKAPRPCVRGQPSWSQVKVSKEYRQVLSSGCVTYRKLADCTFKKYRLDTWPDIGEGQATKVWDALCLHRECEFHQEFPVKAFSWRLPTANEFNVRFCTDEVRISLFERAGLRNPDGTSIKLTSHQFRHWLSTMSERAGMDDYTLAQWAGRAKPSDNRHYDHRSPEERLEQARQLLLGEKPGLLERLQNRSPVSYRELGLDRPGTAKATLYGMCTHDYAMAPCAKQRECMTCKEHVCIKGDHVTLERVRLLEEQTRLLLERAERAHEAGDFGADRWVDNHKWKLAHVRTMRMVLEREDVTDGTPVRIPDGHDPSPVRRALMELGLCEAPLLEPGVTVRAPLRLGKV